MKTGQAYAVDNFCFLACQFLVRELLDANKSVTYHQIQTPEHNPEKYTKETFNEIGHNNGGKLWE